MSELFESVYQKISSLSLSVLLYIVWGAFALIFLLALVLCLFNRGVRRADKRPFLCMVNAFAAVTFAVALSKKGVSFSVMLAVMFWCVGYIMYGAIVLAARRKLPSARRPLPDIAPPQNAFPPSVLPAKTNVRTEHALSVTEKLLALELGRGDRQEVERVKSALSVMRLKGDLSPEENERLNENFSLLLKLMAKYNI